MNLRTLKTRSDTAREQLTTCHTMAMAAYPRCPYFQTKLGEFKERSARVILSETNTEFKMTPADQNLLTCDRVDIRLFGDLRNTLKDNQLAALTDHSEVAHSSTERPVISVLTVSVRFETIDQLIQTLEAKLDRFSVYDIIYVETEGCNMKTEDVNKTIVDVIKYTFPDIDTDQQLVISLSRLQITTASNTYEPYHEHKPVISSTVEDDEQANRTAETIKSSSEYAFPQTQIQTRSMTAQKHNRPDSSGSATSDKSPSELKRLDSRSSDEEPLSDMDIFCSEPVTSESEEASSPHQQEGSNTSKTRRRTITSRRFNLLRLGSMESDEPMTTGYGAMETESDTQQDQQQQGQHRPHQRQQQHPQHQHDLRPRKNRSPYKTIPFGLRPSKEGTVKSPHSKSASIPSQDHHKHQHQSAASLHHDPQKHKQQEQHQQSSSSSNEVAAILVSDFNLGKAISFRLEDRLFLFLSTIEDALREAKRVLNDNGSTGSQQFTTIDKLLFEMRGYYNRGMSALCRQKQAMYRRPIPRDLRDKILDINEVLGCGRVYGRFTVHIRDDSSIDTEELRTNVRKRFQDHNFGGDEEIIIEKMVREVKSLSLTVHLSY